MYKKLYENLQSVLEWTNDTEEKRQYSPITDSVQNVSQITLPKELVRNILTLYFKPDTQPKA